MENNVVYIINAYPEFKYNSQAIESIRSACNRWGVTFIEKTKNDYKNLNNFLIPNKVFWLFENLNNFDKVLFLDADMVINENCESPFPYLDGFDICVVKDKQEGRSCELFFDKVREEHILNSNNSIEIFERNIENFKKNTYIEGYFNSGFMLFRPKWFSFVYYFYKKIIYYNEDLYNYMSTFWAEQNLINAVVLSKKDIKINYLPTTWNYIAPDILDEYHTHYLKDRMIPKIYHFCGTDSSKQSLITYKSWRIKK